MKKVWIDIEPFLNKYLSSMSVDMFVALRKAIKDGHKRCGMDKSDYDTIVNEFERRERIDLLLNETARRNNEGIALEKEGRVDEAISIYEENIADGYPATHSFDRLVVLYRKKKDAENEKRVIHRAFEVFGESTYSDKLKARLNKIKE